MRRVTIRNQPTVVLSGRDTILGAALDAGVPYPHDCRTGTCGTCKSRLVDGKVDMLPHAPEALNPAEAASGLILACRARARTDVVVEWLGEADGSRPPVRTLKTQVCAIKTATPEVTCLQLEVVGQPLYFLAGQYADLSFGRRPARAFSMANMPTDPVLEFHVRHLGGVASGYVANGLKIGERVRVKGPYGNAYHRPEGKPLLAIAGGVGLAPLRSIVLTALALDADASIHLYLGARDEDDLYGDEELDALAARHPHFHFVPVLSEPSGPTRRRTGMVHEAVAADFGRLDRYVIHTAGPVAMVEAARALALQRGALSSAIRSDPFQPHAEDGGGLLRAVFTLGSSLRRKAG